MARTIGYLRVSTDEQLHGYGMDAQLSAIRAAVGEPDAVYRDGVSHDTIHKAKVIQEKADEETKEKLREGETYDGYDPNA